MVKKQISINNNVSFPEEEDETEKTKIEEEDIFSESNSLFTIASIHLAISWPELNTEYSFLHISKHTPPPKV